MLDMLVGHQEATRETKVSQDLSLCAWLKTDTCPRGSGGESPSWWGRNLESRHNPGVWGLLTKHCLPHDIICIGGKGWPRVGRGRSRERRAIGRRCVAAWPDRLRVPCNRGAGE